MFSASRGRADESAFGGRAAGRFMSDPVKAMDSAPPRATVPRGGTCRPVAAIEAGMLAGAEGVPGSDAEIVASHCTKDLSWL